MSFFLGHRQQPLKTVHDLACGPTEKILKVLDSILWEEQTAFDPVLAGMTFLQTENAQSPPSPIGLAIWRPQLTTGTKQAERKFSLYVCSDGGCEGRRMSACMSVLTGGLRGGKFGGAPRLDSALHVIPPCHPRCV